MAGIAVLAVELIWSTTNMKLPIYIPPRPPPAAFVQNRYLQPIKADR
jgi:hypothetical protein